MAAGRSDQATGAGVTGLIFGEGESADVVADGPGRRVILKTGTRMKTEKYEYQIS